MENMMRIEKAYTGSEEPKIRTVMEGQSTF